MHKLVVMKGDNVFTDSLVIAEGTGNKHKNVKELKNNRRIISG